LRGNERKGENTQTRRKSKGRERLKQLWCVVRRRRGIVSFATRGGGVDLIFKHTVSHRKEKQLTNEKIGTSTLPVSI
jgi:hypothetical protein